MTAVLHLDKLPPVPAPEVRNGVVDGRTLDDLRDGLPPADGWHDGDTVTVWVRTGDGYARWNVRVLGAACLELNQPGGEETRDELNRRLPAGTPVVLVQVGDDKYGGRKLARVIYADPVTGRSVDVAEQLVADRWAMPWDGRGQQPRIPWPREEVILC